MRRSLAPRARARSDEPGRPVGCGRRSGGSMAGRRISALMAVAALAALVTACHTDTPSATHHLAKAHVVAAATTTTTTDVPSVPAGTYLVATLHGDTPG